MEKYKLSYFIYFRKDDGGPEISVKDEWLEDFMTWDDAWKELQMKFSKALLQNMRDHEIKSTGISLHSIY